MNFYHLFAEKISERFPCVGCILLEVFFDILTLFIHMYRECWWHITTAADSRCNREEILL